MLPIAVLAGPTASGKTALALELGERHPLEVVSADAMMVYRGMDIGTAKPTPGERARVPHHVVDVAEPDESFDLGRWLDLAERAIDDIIARARVPLVVGGTGFYIRALTEGSPTVPASDARAIRALEAELSERGLHVLEQELRDGSAIDADRSARNPRRVLRALEILRSTGRPPSDFPLRPPRRSYVKIVLDPPRADLDLRIEARVDAMLGAGLIDEALGLQRRWQGADRRPTALQAIGYREALDLIAGRTTPDEARSRMVLATRQYARRQATWFRKEPRAQHLGSAGEAGARLEALLGQPHGGAAR